MDIMYRLLKEMTDLGRQLDSLQYRTIYNWKTLAMLKAENRRYRNIFEMSSQRLFLKDDRFRYVICSRGFASDYNLSVNEVIGRCDEQLVPMEVAMMRTQQEKRMLESGQIEDSVEILNFDGQEKAFITLRAPIMDEEGVTFGIFGVSLDISFHWRRLAELENLCRQQDNLLKDQSQQINDCRVISSS
jgi:PAS domain-containing protein